MINLFVVVGFVMIFLLKMTLCTLVICIPALAVAVDHKVVLGGKLFNDIRLSKRGTQACSTCHNQDRAFTDSRNNKASKNQYSASAVSLGDDGRSYGDINTPSIAYASYIPEFYFDGQESVYKGGLFLNGRSKNLFEQAKEPFLNPIEMNMSKHEVVHRVGLYYSQSMKRIFGDDIFDEVDRAFNAIVRCIVLFEKSEFFSSFDSKFDKSLLGMATLTKKEELGLEVFSSEEKGNCSACHPVPLLDSPRSERLFTDFTYDNLGVPKNTVARSLNGFDEAYVDSGLYSNPHITNPSLIGAFRVPSLRNIAVTSPYMHNGVFSNLDTVIHFYNSRDKLGAKNPETGKLWREAEFDLTKNAEEMGDLGLSLDEIEWLIAFLKTLTDERYENLLLD